ncbi:DUF1168-domain-containing protein [Biscogniauxia mediterranea]|nr:DUF1168-domain-containing protein [Biscogniauxia mediterranea]
MSGEGPESIPTSADPRSKRPTKKRALSPASAQAQTLQTLFAKPDQPIRIPDPSSAPGRRALTRAPPEIVTNVQGSSAGAGSGEFHVYKASRRREYERLRAMDEEVARERGNAEFEQGRAERERRDEERTRRNREKREKKKKAKERAKVSGGSNSSGGGSGNDSVKATNGSNNKNQDGGSGGNATATKGGVKARIDLRKKDDDDEDNGQEAPDAKGEPDQDVNDKPAEEPKGIVIEED